MRVRVTLAFAGVMALVLAATGLFVYLRLESELDATIDQSLRSRAGDVSALVARAGDGLAESGRISLTERGENLAQILDGGGDVVDATAGYQSAPLLTAAERRRALRSTITVERDELDQEDEPARLLGTPVHAQGRDLIVVVGALPGRPPTTRCAASAGCW